MLFTHPKEIVFLKSLLSSIKIKVQSVELKKVKFINYSYVGYLKMISHKLVIMLMLGALIMAPNLEYVLNLKREFINYTILIALKVFVSLENKIGVVVPSGQTVNLLVCLPAAISYSATQKVVFWLQEDQRRRIVLILQLLSCIKYIIIIGRMQQVK